jgi:hypothetical protein
MPTQATGVFDHVVASWPGAPWTGDDIGGEGDLGPGLTSSFRQAGGSFSVTGSGDIAPEVAGDTGLGVGIGRILVGTFAGLLAIIVVASMFITAEYRRGLIRLTLAASPWRGYVLAAKAGVLAAAAFAVGVAAVAIGLPIGVSRYHAEGQFILPASTFTEVRIAIGTGLLLAVAAVLALAIGTAIRRSAPAVAAVIVAVFLPYLLASVPGLLPVGVQEWLLRITPAAGFSLQQAYPRYAQVIAAYRPVDGYYPLGPWAGFAVLCGWAIAGLVLAGYLLRRRDA